MLDMIRWLKLLRKAVSQLSDLVYSHSGRHKPGGADPLFPADYDIAPMTDNTNDLGKPSLRWRTIYAVNVQTGDLVFSNGWRITEDGDKLVLISPDGRKYSLVAEPNT